MANQGTAMFANFTWAHFFPALKVDPYSCFCYSTKRTALKSKGKSKIKSYKIHSQVKLKPFIRCLSEFINSL